MSASPFSDFIIFADETGDHGLVSIDEQFPVFALVFCILRKDDYVDTIVPGMQRLKMAVWGHDQIIFHEHDIRKEKGPFGLLRTDPGLRAWFMDELSRLMAAAPMQLVVSIIDKKRLTQKYCNPYNPYEIAMLFCMERTLGYLRGQGQTGKRVTVAFESRGKREDAELELEFRRICDNQGNWGYKQTNFQEIAFEHLFVDKKSNATGLQLADLVARLLALRYLRPTQPNRAAEIIQDKVLFRKHFP
jgi:hypothetical protein